jgi:preprotein translocase subunit SecB
MNPSPLLLNRYFFTRIELLAHTDGDPGNLNVLSGTVTMGKHNSIKDNYLVTLDFVLGGEEGKKTQYTGRFEIHGYMTVAEGYPEDQREMLVNTNGPAILYSALREMVLNLTSRGPWPPVTLKTVTFLKGPNAHEAKEAIGLPMQEVAAIK